MNRSCSGQRSAHTLLITAALLVGALAMPHIAAAKVERSQIQPSEHPPNLVMTSPPRMEIAARPGTRDVEHMSITNNSVYAQQVTLTPTDFAASSDPHQIGHAVENGEFGAGDWITPEITSFKLAPFEQIDFDVTIDAPADAPSGTNLGAIRMRTASAGSKVAAPVVADALVEVFVTVAGPVRHDLRITSLTTRDSYQFGSNRLVAWDATFRNDGTVNEHVEGSVDVQSIFGTRADRIKIPPMLVLRGASRTVRVLWRDVPWVGAFTPKVIVRGDDAREMTRTGSRTVVLPWWVFPLIALLVVVPALWLWISRRRQWKRYVEDVDADPEDDGYDEPWGPAAPGAI